MKTENIVEIKADSKY